MALASTSCAFDVSSSNPSPGEKVTLTGTANPGQKVDFQTSFQMDLPVNSGRYEYVATGVNIPQKPNRFEVSASGVKNINMGVKIVIWISKRFNATNGRASISQSDIPPGNYDLKVFGDALDGANSVNLKVIAQTAVNADSAGKYSLAIDTSGIPSGAYKIEGAGETKTIQVGGFEETRNAASESPSLPVASQKTGLRTNVSPSNNQTATNPVVQNPAEKSSNGQNISSPQQPAGAGQEEGFIGLIQDSLKGIFG